MTRSDLVLETDLRQLDRGTDVREREGLEIALELPRQPVGDLRGRRGASHGAS